MKYAIAAGALLATVGVATIVYLRGTVAEETVAPAEPAPEATEENAAI